MTPISLFLSSAPSGTVITKLVIHKKLHNSETKHPNTMNKVVNIEAFVVYSVQYNISKYQ
jgi:hypothetical protein